MVAPFDLGLGYSRKLQRVSIRLQDLIDADVYVRIARYASALFSLPEVGVLLEAQVAVTEDY